MRKSATLTQILLNSRSWLFVVAALPVNSVWLHSVDTCVSVKGSASPEVVVVKQWHLPPSVHTKDASPDAAPLPQAKNQKEIYEQLEAWTSHNQIDTAIAEGCEGEITPDFKLSFQGWSYADLKARAQDVNFADLMSNVVVKLKAKSPDAIRARCGDNLAEIKTSENALSDARADVGYLTRISESKEDPMRLKPYLDGVIEAYHLKAGTTALDAQNALAKDLKESLKKFRDSTHARNLSFAKQAQDSGSKKPVVIVVGGLHAQDLKQILESKKLNCTILEPVSYQNDEEAMSARLSKITSEPL